MANTFIQGMLRLRFLWVAAIAITSFEPLLTDAGSKQTGMSILEAQAR